MLVKDFNEKYKEKGGIKKLSEYRSLLFSIDYIAIHFGVSKQRVKQWMFDFFGENHDAREDRREAIIQGMIDFAKRNTKDEFKSAFAGAEHYKEAMNRCIETKIYDIE